MWSREGDFIQFFNRNEFQFGIVGQIQILWQLGAVNAFLDQLIADGTFLGGEERAFPWFRQGREIVELGQLHQTGEAFGVDGGFEEKKSVSLDDPQAIHGNPRDLLLGEDGESFGVAALAALASEQRWAICAQRRLSMADGCSQFHHRLVVVAGAVWIE